MKVRLLVNLKHNDGIADAKTIYDDEVAPFPEFIENNIENSKIVEVLTVSAPKAPAVPASAPKAPVTGAPTTEAPVTGAAATPAAKPPKEESKPKLAAKVK